MKKVVGFLTLSSLVFAPASYAEQRGAYSTGNQYCDEFIKGIAAGAVATWGVEILRERVLPDMGSFKLYDNYGICRYRLEGEARVAAAAIGLAVYDQPTSLTAKKSAAQMAGIIVGACVANYITKLTSK